MIELYGTAAASDCDCVALIGPDLLLAKQTSGGNVIRTRGSQGQLFQDT